MPSCLIWTLLIRYLQCSCCGIVNLCINTSKNKVWSKYKHENREAINCLMKANKIGFLLHNSFLWTKSSKSCSLVIHNKCSLIFQHQFFLKNMLCRFIFSCFNLLVIITMIDSKDSYISTHRLGQMKAIIARFNF